MRPTTPTRIASLLLVLSLVSGNHAFAQQETKQKSPPPSAAQPPQYILALYYSNKPKGDAKKQVDLARLAIQQAKKPVAEGGLGAYKGSGSMVAEDNRQKLIANLGGGPGASKEAIEKAIRQADGLLPFLEDGYGVFFIADPGNREWCYGPIMVEPSVDEEDAFAQVKFAQNRHQARFPNHYLAAATTTPAPATGTLAAAPASVTGTGNPILASAPKINRTADDRK